MTPTSHHERQSQYMYMSLMAAGVCPDGHGNSLLVRQYGDEGFYGPEEIPEDILEGVHKVSIRDDDVILLSYPKSGCHWLWEMIRMLRAGTANVNLVEKEKYMLEYMPRDELDKLPSPRTFNTHFFFRQLPPAVHVGKCKLCFIYRNPKDVAVSFYNHHYKFPEYEYKGTWSDYLTGLFLPGQVDFWGYFTYMKDWEKVMDEHPELPVYTLSYEELHADTFTKTKEVAQFLGSTADDDTIRDIIAKCSFDSMRDRKGKEWTEVYGEPVMYRKGKVGDWKSWFTVAQNEMFDAICQKEMKGSRFKLQYTL
nr:hypothetical protein BaRGS_016461 [Batillaria attramentaria]